MKDQRLSIFSPSWKTTSLLQSRSTSQGKICNPSSLCAQVCQNIETVCEFFLHSMRRYSSLCMFLMVNWNSRYGYSKPLFFFLQVLNSKVPVMHLTTYFRVQRKKGELGIVTVGDSMVRTSKGLLLTSHSFSSPDSELPRENYLLLCAKLGCYTTVKSKIKELHGTK